MPSFKIIKSYIIDATDKVSARQIFAKAQDQDIFLESIYIKEVESAVSGRLLDP